jgi:1-phosphatidylinositol-3-phosphate 5-kinase
MQERNFQEQDARRYIVCLFLYHDLCPKILIAMLSLMSFAKFMELLVYSPSLSFISPPLCEHTSPPPRPWQSPDMPLPRSRLNIVRHFAYAGHVMSISLRQIENLYEVRVPRLQILRSRFEKQEDSEAVTETASDIQSRVAADDHRRALRREIMQFWQSLSEQMDTLEENFINDHAEKSYHKTLPRLPSADEAYDSFDEDGLATPKGHPSDLPPLPPNTPLTPRNMSSGHQAYPFPTLDDAERSLHPHSASSATTSTSDTASSSSSEPSSLQLLTSMRHTFQRTEQSLYAELARVPSASLNDVRRSFISAGRGAGKRLSAWEAKHASGPPIIPEAAARSEPEWWQTGCHAVPGGNVIVRENDWGSIIAFTLR